MGQGGIIRAVIPLGRLFDRKASIDYQDPNVYSRNQRTATSWSFGQVVIGDEEKEKLDRDITVGLWGWVPTKALGNGDKKSYISRYDLEKKCRGEYKHGGNPE